MARRERSSSERTRTAMIALVAAIGAMSGLLVGYNTAVIAPAAVFVTHDFRLGPLAQGVVVSAVLLGGLVGSVAAGSLIRRLGERPVLLATALLFVVGPVGSAFAGSFASILAWRMIVGFGVGAATMVAPLYVGETSPAELRGALVSVIQLAITLGILMSYLAGALWTPAGWWQAMLGVGAAPGLVMFAAVLAAPESPRWYLLCGRTAEAERAHVRLTGGRGEALPIRVDDSPTDAWRDLFSGRNRGVLLVAAGLFAFANLSGIDAILYYAPMIFARIGVGGTLGPILATVGVGAVNVLATIVAMALIDRIGRRPLLIGGLIPMALSLIVLAIALTADRHADWANTLAVACLCLFVMAFAVSLGPLPYVLTSELFPLALRGAGIGMASATAWGVNVLVSLTFPVLIGSVGIAPVFGLYGLVSVGAWVFVIVLVPETRGRSLELIEANLAAWRRLRDLRMPPPTGRLDSLTSDGVAT